MSLTPACPSRRPRTPLHRAFRPPLHSAAIAMALALTAGCAAPHAPAFTGPLASAHAAAVSATPAPQRSAAPPASAAEPESTPQAPNAADEQASFERWRLDFSQQALARGIRPETVRTVLGAAQRQPRVVELDRSQPEFTRPPWAYLDSAVSPQRVTQGRSRLSEHQQLLQANETRYGVPAAIITAIWGIESNFGSNFGTFRAVDALATLAWEGRRRGWAQAELLAALRIVDQGDIAPERMISSWAGAMGHTQFLPSVFLAHAVDADGDGRRDIWGSIPDVVASTANFLARMGWQAGQPWGVEVVLPPGFDYLRTEPAIRQSAAAWASEGVKPVEGQVLPALPDASVIAPAGSRGPAFLVGPNFRTILRYNNSVNYALAVGLLARLIEEGPAVANPWPRDITPLSRDQLRQLQTALNAKGHDAGAPDGVMGPATRAALRKFQQQIGAVPDGYPTLDLLQRAQMP